MNRVCSILKAPSKLSLNIKQYYCIIFLSMMLKIIKFIIINKDINMGFG